MIVLNENMGVDIPNYDDLDNKPSINGVVLEGNKTTEDLKIEGDLYDLGQGMKFESGTAVTYDVDSEFYFNTINSIHDDKILIAIVDNVVKVFNLITENDRYLMFGASVAESDGVLIDYITLTKVFSNIDATNITGFKLSYQSDYYSYSANVDLTGYATEQWVEDKGYLTSVPSEYVTETELNEVIANLDVTIPYVVVKIESGAGSVIAGDIISVRDAKSNNKPCLAYVYNLDEAYGMIGSFHLCSIQSINPTTAITNLIYHTELGTTHKTVLLSVAGGGRVTITTDEHSYTTSDELNTAIHTRQTKLVSGMNIKTINGNSILGSGDLTIEGGTTDLSNYYTKSEIDAQIGDINTILENIIG